VFRDFLWALWISITLISDCSGSYQLSGGGGTRSSALRTFFAMVALLALEPFVRRRTQPLVRGRGLAAVGCVIRWSGEICLIGASRRTAICAEASDNFLLAIVGEAATVSGRVSRNLPPPPCWACGRPGAGAVCR